MKVPAHLPHSLTLSSPGNCSGYQQLSEDAGNHLIVASFRSNYQTSSELDVFLTESSVFVGDLRKSEAVALRDVVETVYSTSKLFGS